MIVDMQPDRRRRSPWRKAGFAVCVALAILVGVPLTIGAIDALINLLGRVGAV